MELMDTVAMMQSEDFKERFRAEYFQTKIRRDKLAAMLVKLRAGKLDFTPKCEFWLLDQQRRQMEEYLNTLEIRAAVEEIDLT